MDKNNPTKYIIQAIIGAVVLGVSFFMHGGLWSLLFLGTIILAVLNGVHHAEVIAAKVGQPFGSLVLAVAITIIEVSIILSLMHAGGSHASELARDTIFGAVMIIINGLLGLSLMVGAIKHHEQVFNSQGVISVLTILVTISVITFILPNFSSTLPGPYYSNQQLLFVSIGTLVLYFAFLFVQNFKHKSHFVSDKDVEQYSHKPLKKEWLTSLILLPINLVVVVVLAEHLAPELELFIKQVGAPTSLSGLIIASIILLPEGISAVKAARKNQLQTSLNLSLGSALASISLSIPVVSIYAIYSGLPLALGVDGEASVLFLLSLMVIVLCLSTGRTTILQGIVLMLLFFVYLFIGLS